MLKKPRNIVLHDTNVTITFKNVKHVRYKATPDGLQVNAPNSLSLKTVTDILENSWTRIDKALQHSKNNTVLKPESAPTEMLLEGKLLKIVNKPGVLNISINKTTIEIYAPENQHAFALNYFIQNRLWEKLNPLIEKWSRILNVTPSSRQIKPLTYAWAHAKKETGALVFNQSLIHVNPQLLEYVVLHELAHLIEPNHGKKFYEIVSRNMPDYRSCELGLKSFSF